jgi:hypothetical protein
MPHALSQIPQGFNYQAIARDAGGNPIINTSLPVMITIQSDSLGTGVIWQELHSAVTSNSFGMINLIIGKGSRQAVSAVANFSDIAWSVTPKFIKTEIDYSGWKIMGVSRLWSVPYALRSRESDQWITSGLNIYRDYGYKVGIGNASPANFLDVQGGINAGGIINYNSVNRLGLGVIGDGTPNGLPKNDEGAYVGWMHSGLGHSAGSLALISRSFPQNCDISFYTGNVDPIERMTIKYNGNVGIGTVNPSSIFTVQPPLVWDDNTPLFEIKNKNGQTVFAVYNEGVRVYVADEAKGVKSGFAVGGFGTDKAESQKYLVVSKDSVRIYLDTNPATKKLKGGFAVGGYDLTKGTTIEDYLQVTRDSTRIYVNEGSDKKLKGGFAVGGFDMTKGTQTITPFTSLKPENYFIGHKSGIKTTSGLYNSFVGYETGLNNTSGKKNIFLGYHAGMSNDTASFNVFIGNESGINTIRERNVFIGYRTGFNNTTGHRNVFMGEQAGLSNTSGDNNDFIGHLAGRDNNSGHHNIFIGTQSGISNTSGFLNVYIGYETGYYNTIGKKNTFIGTDAGAWCNSGNYNVYVGYKAGYGSIHDLTSSASHNVMIGDSAGRNISNGIENVIIGSAAGVNNQTGSGNVFVGAHAGFNEVGSDKLYIDNSDTDSPLIYGDFYNNRVIINGKSTDNTFGRKLFVKGDAGGLYAWYNDSDKKLKHDITTIPDALQKVLKLRGVNFLWNTPTKGMDGVQMGFIGQEAAEIVPEVVSVINDRYSMQYAPITALLVEGMKEQQQQIESVKLENKQLKSEIDDLKALVNSLIENHK